MKRQKEYALYKGDKCLVIGTLKEIAIERNVKVRTIYYYNSPAYKKRCEKSPNRIELVCLDEE